MNNFYTFLLLFAFSVTGIYGCGGGSGDGEAPQEIVGVNTAPTADAGDNLTVVVGVPVILDGSGSSDPDGDPLSYQWTLQSRPGNSNSSLSTATEVNPSFIPDVAGDYVINLVVNDGAASSIVDTVIISASVAVNNPPVANAGADDTVFVGDTVILDGSGSSDPDSDTLSYQWNLQSQPAGSSSFLSTATEVDPSFIPDVAGDYTISLVVNDGTVDSSADTVTITAASLANNPPVADAGADDTVTVGDTVTLDGSGSSDPDGDPLTYQWTLQSKPATSSSILANATTVNPSFVPDVAGVYTVSLVVDDGTDNSPADSVDVTATAPGGSVAAGQAKYDADCASCHAAGSYDPTSTGSAGDLYGKSNLIISDISSYSTKKSSVADLTAQEILDLKAFIDNL